MIPDAAGRFDVQPTVGNHYSWIRTQMGLQRTLMAAVRTSVSLIGFGFTVAQFFQRLLTETEGAGRLGPQVPRDFGLVLIAAGVLSLAVFTWQYHSMSAYLRGAPFTAIAGVTRRPMHSSSYITAFAVMLIGVAAFLSVFARF